MPTMLRAVFLGLLLAPGLAAVSPPPADAQRTKVYQPEDPNKEIEGLSIKPRDVAPQLMRSVEYAFVAMSQVAAAQHEGDLVKAADTLMLAYRLQRAAHTGLAYMEGPRSNRPGDTIKWEYRVIGAARSNLLEAQRHFRGSQITNTDKIENGLEHLRAAISQTQSVLAIHR